MKPIPAMTVNRANSGPSEDIVDLLNVESRPVVVKGLPRICPASLFLACFLFFGSVHFQVWGCRTQSCLQPCQGLGSLTTMER